MYQRSLALIFFGVMACGFLSGNARAQNGITTLVKQPRQTAMGGAGVGLADDEYALFMNPAGLAGQETRRFKLIGLGVEAPLETYTTLSQSLSALGNFSLSTLNDLMGKEIYVRSSLVPVIQLPHFAITYLLDVQGAIEQFNQANPTFKIGNMVTHGVQAGLGWSLKSGRRATDEWRFGFAGKILFRRGGYFDVNTAGFLQVASGGMDYINSLVGSYGTGYGADVGIQYVKHIDPKQDFYFGASVTDVFGTSFSSPQAQKIVMNPSIGFAYRRQLEFLKFKIAADLRNLDQSVSIGNKTHIGTEVSVPLFDFYAGLNQLNFTYGASFDIWVLRLTLLSYAEELGVRFHQLTSRRYMLQVDFSLPI
jgi:hypothetical protein